MFKNATLYRITGTLPGTAAQLETLLTAERFQPCSVTQAKSTGWVPPRDQDHGALLEAIGGNWIARFMIETKAVPALALRRWVDEKALHIEQTRGRKPGKRELRDLREDALLALLPQAFPRQTAVWVWIDPQSGLLALDIASQAKADDVIASLTRVAGQGLGIRLLQTNTAPRALMTDWLLAEDSGEVSDAFQVERDCELKASGDEPARVRFDRHELGIEEVRRHVREGKLPVSLSLSWQGRVGFTLTKNLQIKKIRFDEGVFGERQTQEEDRFDADVAMTTGELTGLIADLIETLGGTLGEEYRRAATLKQPQIDVERKAEQAA